MPTALELSRKEWQRYIKAARYRTIQTELTSAEREAREHLLVRIHEAARNSLLEAIKRHGVEL